MKVPLHNLIANKDTCNDKHHKSGRGLSKWIINICSHIMILNVNFGRNQRPLSERMRQFSRDLRVMQLEQSDWPMMYTRLVTLC